MSSTPRREVELTFLRLVPGTSPVHRLCAGTKLLIAAELALIVSIEPSWPMLGGGAALVAPSLWSGTHPLVHAGPIDLSLGGLSDWARFTVLAIVLLASGALIGWTTPLGDVAPALATLSKPLRRLRLPVDEWVVAIALAIRCLPMLLDEIRTLNAARRLRAADRAEAKEHARAGVRELLVETHDLMATAIVVSIRRARDLADAIIARGGIGGAVSAEAGRFRALDASVLVASTAVSAVAIVFLYLHA